MRLKTKKFLDNRSNWDIITSSVSDIFVGKFSDDSDPEGPDLKPYRNYRLPYLEVQVNSGDQFLIIYSSDTAYIPVESISNPGSIQGWIQVEDISDYSSDVPKVFDSNEAIDYIVSKFNIDYKDDIYEDLVNFIDDLFYYEDLRDEFDDTINQIQLDKIIKRYNNEIKQFIDNYNK